jgi:glycosyltransferase involved in cell wall biosynthesis
MISFVWSSKYPFLSGAGGSENYTVGQIRELMRRGIPCRILTLGFGEEDGRENFPDIQFRALKSKEELSELDDTIVFITYPLNVKTKHKSYVILHCPPVTAGDTDPLFDYRGLAGKGLIAPSRFTAKMWAKELKRTALRIPISYPFAEPVFSKIERKEEHDDGVLRILFAARLTPDKGIYTLLAALHLCGLEELPLELTVTTAGDHTPEGKVLRPILEAHPRVRVVPAQKTSEGMAALMAEHDMVVNPSTNIFWKEIFGIVSVEAQHAGCRVVASRAGGIPETDCGGLITVSPDNPQALARGILKAAALGPLTAKERATACAMFTVKQSVDQLLKIIASQPGKALPHVGPMRIPDLSPQLALFGDRLKQSAYGQQYYGPGSSLARQKN